jgi:hypothetical protein
MEPQRAEWKPGPSDVYVAVEILPVPNLGQVAEDVVNQFLDECPRGTIYQPELRVPQNEDGGFITFYVHCPESRDTAQTYLDRLNRKLLEKGLISGKDQVLRKP